MTGDVQSDLNHGDSISSQHDSFLWIKNVFLPLYRHSETCLRQPEEGRRGREDDDPPETSPTTLQRNSIHVLHHSDVRRGENDNAKFSRISFSILEGKKRRLRVWCLFGKWSAFL